MRGAKGLEIEDGYFESEDFETASYGLEIDLDIGIGQATIIWVD
jgi:hypothetical protein